MRNRGALRGSYKSTTYGWFSMLGPWGFILTLTAAAVYVYFQNN